MDPKKQRKIENLLKKNRAQTDPAGAIWDEVLSISEKLDEILTLLKNNNN